MLWKFLSIAICFNDRFCYYLSIQYWPNNISMKVSIDTYCRPQPASKSANRYLSQATIRLLLPIGIGAYRLSIDLAPIVQGVIRTTQGIHTAAVL